MPTTEVSAHIGPLVTDLDGDEIDEVRRWVMFNDNPGYGKHYIQLTAYDADGQRCHTFEYFRFDGTNCEVVAMAASPFEVIEHLPWRFQDSATAKAEEFMAKDYPRLISGELSVR